MAYEGELTTEEGFRVLDDLAQYEVPHVLLSGGEPTTRKDLVDLVAHGTSIGLKPVLSTNGTLLTSEFVDRLASAGLDRVGISLDGMERVNDRFRGSRGAFGAAVSGIRNSVLAGMRVSLRVTATRRNVADLPDLFELAELEGVPRICVYHLAYAGRGQRLLSFDLDQAERRAMLEFVFQQAIDFHHRGVDMEVLTVDNHADGPFLLQWSRERAPDRSGEVERLLLRNGGNSAGQGVACIDNVGNVHPDQFWWNQTVGNVREQPFSSIWSDDSNPLLMQLRDRKSRLDETCRSCRWLSICNGNLRVRAEASSGSMWGHDPACYLTPNEIGVAAA